MKLFTFLALFLITLYAPAQVSFVEYYTKDNKKTKKIEDAHYSRLMTLDENNKVSVKDTYLSTDKTKLLGTYKSLKERTFVGQKLQGYENGQLKSKEHYSYDGKLIDTALYYYPNGKVNLTFEYPYTESNGKTTITDTLILLYRDSLNNILLTDGNGYAEIEDDGDIEKGSFLNHKREGEWKGSFSNHTYQFIEKYEAGKLISGITTDRHGSSYPYDQKTFRKQPEYPGGINSLRQFIAQNYRYSREAIMNGATGTVKIAFIVEKDGKMSSFDIEQDIGFGTGGEAVNVLKRVKKTWSPGIYRGVPVRVSYTLPIRLNMR